METTIVSLSYANSVHSLDRLDNWRISMKKAFSDSRGHGIEKQGTTCTIPTPYNLKPEPQTLTGCTHCQEMARSICDKFGSIEAGSGEFQDLVFRDQT